MKLGTQRSTAKCVGAVEAAQQLTTSGVDVGSGSVGHAATDLFWFRASALASHPVHRHVQDATCSR